MIEPAAGQVRIGDLRAKHKLPLGGLGWGAMSEPMVRADVESGRLVRLNLHDRRSAEYIQQVVHMMDTPPEVAGRWLFDRLAASSAAENAETSGS
jgi:DNA-binding transcriptional LysR family regulator